MTIDANIDKYKTVRFAANYISKHCVAETSFSTQSLQHLAAISVLVNQHGRNKPERSRDFTRMYQKVLTGLTRLLRARDCSDL